MRLELRPLFPVALAAGLLLSSCASSSADDRPARSAGAKSADAAAAFTAPELGGGELSSASFAGEDTVLWFWAPWCTSCRAEADDVVAAAAALDGEVEIVGIAGRGAVEEMEDFVSDTRTGGLTHVVDEDGSIWSSYEVIAQPAYAFIDDSGAVDVHVGALGEAALVERMTELAER